MLRAIILEHHSNCRHNLPGRYKQTREKVQRTKGRSTDGEGWHSKTDSREEGEKKGRTVYVGRERMGGQKGKVDRAYGNQQIKSWCVVEEYNYLIFWSRCELWFWIRMRTNWYWLTTAKVPSKSRKISIKNHSWPAWSIRPSPSATSTTR